MKKALIGILALSLVIECGLTAAGFVAPEFTIAQFGVAVTPDTRFLGFVIAWLLALVATICAFTLKKVVEDNPEGWALSSILGFWWIGIGIGIYLGFHRPENLVFDTLKGLMIVVFAKLSHPRPTQS